MSATPNFGLTKFPDGNTTWGTPMNANLDAIDTAIAARMILPVASAAIGDLFYWTGSAVARLAAPAAGKILIGNGVGQIPSYQALLSSIMTVNANIDMLSQYRLTNLLDPTANQHAATKAYVDTQDVAYSPGRLLKVTCLNTAGSGTFTTQGKTAYIMIPANQMT